MSDEPESGLWRAVEDFDARTRGERSRNAALLALRVSTAGLMLWWGLLKALGLPSAVAGMSAGRAVSDRYYGGAFSNEAALSAFGWAQVLMAALLAVGLLRAPLLWAQLVVNLFVAAAVGWSLVDPLWLWGPGDRPATLNLLFYPSAIVVAASWLLIAFRAEDAWALDRVVFSPRTARRL